MMSYRHKAFQILRKRNLFFISAEDLQNQLELVVYQVPIYLWRDP